MDEQLVIWATEEEVEARDEEEINLEWDAWIRSLPKYPESEESK